MFLIYPFHKFQKNISFIEEMHVWLKSNEYKIAENYEELYSLYGAESVWLATIFNIESSEKQYFENWKFINKLWNILNIETNIECENFDIYKTKLIHYQKQNKMHLFISMLHHIVKNCKKGLSEKQKNDFYNITKQLLPYLFLNKI